MRDAVADAGRDPADLKIVGGLTDRSAGSTVRSTSTGRSPRSRPSSTPALTDLRARLPLPDDPSAAEELAATFVAAFRQVVGAQRLMIGRVAVVTGGSGRHRGLPASPGRWACRGDRSPWARRPDRSADAVAELRAEGIVAEAFRCDVGHEADVEAAAAATIARFGWIDVCVANAGGGAGGHALVELPLEDGDRIVGVNLTGRVLRFLAASRHGHPGRRRRLVAVSSAAAVDASPGAVRLRGRQGRPGRPRPQPGDRAGAVGHPGEHASSRAGRRTRGCPSIVSTTRWRSRRWPPSRPGGGETPRTTSARPPALSADPTLRHHTGAVLAVDGGYSIMAPYLAVRQTRATPPRDTRKERAWLRCGSTTSRR